MSTSPATVPAVFRSGGDPSRAGVLVAALAVTQTIGYGSLYYAFAVFLSPIATDLRISTTTVAGAFTANVLAAGVLAVPVGRWLDRHGGWVLMTAGSAVGAVLLVALAHVQHAWQLYVVQAGIGAAASACLYEAAFAVVIAATVPARRGHALLALTVVAGFASSIFLPLTGTLVDRYGWRTALLVLAGLHGALTVPLHAYAVRPPPTLRLPRLRLSRPLARRPPPMRSPLPSRPASRRRAAPSNGPSSASRLPTTRCSPLPRSRPTSAGTSSRACSPATTPRPRSWTCWRSTSQALMAKRSP